ncbi:cyclic AMP-dependent transcription factor ATF-2 [Belonocnema kinseyi]|uniref:cyclic AMP-dependent transcription factor ATF-2 n=1 Tax=Belonocnema kinseyi TaxID=2817044 RepID=UPI00143D6BC8|nr:cyclic AMP-dependent transcription factor ATF-2 [Belonocnema kinseyi]
MDDTGKPFACPSPGCNMSFTNEDHLTVHKKKHDMILNFGMNGKGSAFIADQTPTPTRFIRNCEEVGLFQDLQSVNPFEETFRRAVEAGKTGSISVSEIGIVDDTLHTPHIFPHIEESPSTNRQVLPQTTISVPPTITVTETSNETSSTKTKIRRSRVRKKNSKAEEVVKKLKITTTCTNSIEKTERIVVKQTNTAIVPKVPAVQAPAPLSINGEEVQLLLKTSDGKLLQLSAAPVADSQSSINSTNNQRLILKTEPPLRTAKEAEQKSTEASKLSIAKMKLKQALTKGLSETVNEKKEKIAEKVKESSPSKENRRKQFDQKQDILERNRASSMRCRARRKAWIQELETTVKNVNDRNSSLQTEVKSLRSEVAKLKALLLAHKDCPITKAMEKGNSIVVGSKVNIIPANAEMVPAIPIPIDASIKRTSLPVEVPILTTKLILSRGKNTTILPNDKGDNKITGALSRARLFKKLPALKIVDVDPGMISERDEQFLILQSSPASVSKFNSRDIIEMNPMIHVENAASKSTGT